MAVAGARIRVGTKALATTGAPAGKNGWSSPHLQTTPGHTAHAQVNFGTPNGSDGSGEPARKTVTFDNPGFFRVRI